MRTINDNDLWLSNRVTTSFSWLGNGTAERFRQRFTHSVLGQTVPAKAWLGHVVV